MTDDKMTDNELRMVVRHGSNKITRALAAVRLARRKGSVDELREQIEEDTGSPGTDLSGD
jgi:hypothetical protein